ncbi:hypothetical protein J4460_03475 [Candidatus Woesearchaeota archaeon]|nr:MAG: hypothetical protein QS99_C0008G0065 [archaeon GW2011_AR4]MBS3129709.1 hypothetical protein [Candidatus Woesearchaeota archaeon]HIH39011.1 hypothetical protein [Candidatus Woesearchaeota archaeon]HIH49229.1 hypothetical protein [Candidatus Woesearchaeota archaeon]HIJ03371.1 hypothetical protein [Candidatus Woesearchaeota archaeon]
MIVKLLGIGDLICALIILMGPLFGPRVIVFFAMFLLAKGGIFGMSGNFVSVLDFFIGVYMILMGFGVTIKVISVVSMIYLSEKAIMSMLA